jgi:hypothetical protein
VPAILDLERRYARVDNQSQAALPQPTNTAIFATFFFSCIGSLHLEIA